MHAALIEQHTSGDLNEAEGRAEKRAKCQLSALPYARYCAHQRFSTTLQVGINIPIVQIRKWRLRKANELAEGNRLGKKQILDFLSDPSGFLGFLHCSACLRGLGLFPECQEGRKWGEMGWDQVSFKDTACSELLSL